MQQTIYKAKLSLKIIKERQAVDPVLFNVSELTSITDYFLIVGGNSSRQVQAITRDLRKKMRENGFRPYGIEGEQEGRWVLMDYGDIVIHIFHQPYREFYDLEGLWIEAPRVNLDDEQKEENGQG
ncbi:MAG: ribosome silencing factor [Deltaproteobacteria bacterium]|nr:ribosome silencing factor [Deltaproteobacteria bacterium]